MQGQRALIWVSGGVLLLGVGAFYLLRGGEGAGNESVRVVHSQPSPAAGTDADRAALPVAPERASPEVLPASPSLATGKVEVQVPSMPDSYRKALGGLTGRVVEADGKPVPHLQLELVGGRKSSFLKPEDAFLQPGGLDVQLIAGTAVTDDAGRFRLADIEPRTFGGLILDPAGPRALLYPLTTTPVSGTDHDLGDIVMPATATLTGRVVDERGGPLSGVRVRATELPMAGMPGVESIVGAVADFRGGGGVYVKDNDKEFVLSVPGSLTQLEHHLPIPTAISDHDGRFVLTGVMPGVVTIAADDGVHIPAVKTGVPSGAAGLTRDVGTLSMGDGQTLRGKVQTEKGEPVAGAELLAGTSLGVAPAALLKGPVLTDAEGRFQVRGLRTGEIFAAARTDRRQGYTVASSTDATRELLITLPSPRTYTLVLLDEHGAAVTGAKFFGRMIPDNDTPDFLVPPKALDAQTTTPEPGRYLVAELQPGEWEFSVRAPGFGSERTEADLREADVSADLRLVQEGLLALRVLRAADKAPVEWAFVEAFQEGHDIPVAAGRTDVAGRVVLRGLRVRDLSVTVTHPAYAVTSQEATAQLPPTAAATASGGGAIVEGSAPAGGDSEVVVELASGATIAGTLLENNGPPARPLMVILMPNEAPGDGELPRTTVADLDGHFRFERVEPGKAKLEARSKDELGSGLTLFEAFFNSPLAEVEVQVPEQGELQALLVVGGNMAGLETGFVSGQLSVNGRTAAGWKVSTWGQVRRSVVTDEAGRFDLGQIAAGDVSVAFSAAGTSLMEGAAYTENFKLGNGERKFLQVSFGTGGLSGRVTSAVDGRPVAEAVVRAVPAEEGGGWRRSGSAVTGADGRFSFDTLAAGSYRVSGRADGYANSSSDAVKVAELEQVTGVELRLVRAITVSGTVTVSGVATQPQWMWLVATADGSKVRDTSGVDRKTHTFSFDGLAPGEWTFTLASDQDGEFAPISMHFDHDVTDLQLAFTLKPETPEPAADAGTVFKVKVVK